ncbi:hypothetical protein [Nonomuraea sp. NPDC050643]|uniref:hypothetical protein n=1 Tax=Nonomuraea sp. NPDC050643 TaxID=3155660 RepID=UPI0033E5827B
MAFIRTVRFTADPADADQVLARRAALIAAVRAGFPGLAETRLTRIDEGTWADHWRWNSRAEMDAVIAAGPSLPEAKSAFEVVKDASVELGELVDER